MGVEFSIDSIIVDGANYKEYIIHGNTTSDIPSFVGYFSRLRYNIVTSYTVVIPTGLYDLNGINQAVLRGLENLGAKINPDPLISFSPDEPTSRVELRVNYNNVIVHFKESNSTREILGFNSQVYGP